MKKNSAQEDSEGTFNQFSPSKFMRARRPEEYSDSTVEFSPSFDRAFLEYHLDTLTSRSEEKAFEHFCRKIAQKEICPNLTPQTGPTGGGDSKVDTETFPVAPQIALLWYEGNPDAAAERWAFAFSAKKDWRAKVRSDVTGIIQTARGYSLIYFFSNQFIPDKARSKVEDDLSAEHGVRIKIVDRNWLLDRVFKNGHLKISIEALNIAVSAPVEQRKIGPLDREREEQLRNLDSYIMDDENYAGAEYQRADDCLETAVLARELERSQREVEDRFDRAERVAEKYGFTQQTLRIKYQKAWTACYWFDDLKTMARLYQEIEPLALKSGSAVDLERLHTLWIVLLSCLRQKLVSEEEFSPRKHTQRLRKSLRELAADSSRPNNAAHAETLLCILDLVLKPKDNKNIKASFQKLGEIFENSERLGGYPFDKYVQHFMDSLGAAYSGTEPYEKTFEILLPIVEKRNSEAKVGKMLLERGVQHFRNEKYYEAIRTLGRAQQRLVKNELQDDLVYCLINVACAYLAVDLPWAAHQNNISAASTALRRFEEDGIASFAALRSIESLIWIELKLGRIPVALQYIQMATQLEMVLSSSEAEHARYLDQRQDQDWCLALLILRSSLDQLRAIEGLANTLHHLGFFFSYMSLSIALGYEDCVKIPDFAPDGMPDHEVLKVSKTLQSMHEKMDFPKAPEYFEREEVVFSSDALGCCWSVRCDNNETSLRIGESLLGFIEALFATSLEDDAAPHLQNIRIRVRAQKNESSVSDSPLMLDLSDPDYIFTVAYAQDFDLGLDVTEGALRKFLMDSMSMLIPRIFYAPNIDEYLKRIAEAEEAFGRSLIFANTSLPASVLFGHSSAFDLGRWLNTDAKLALKRSEAFKFSEPKASAKGKPRSPREGSAPRAFFDPTKLTHRQRRVLSQIDIDAWDKARWRGALFGTYEFQQPLLCLLFENADAATRIFSGWRADFGDVDHAEIIRVTIITGVDRNAASSYSIGISTNVENTEHGKNPEGMCLVAGRSMTIDNPDPANLQRFLSAQRKFGQYLIAPAILEHNAQPPNFNAGLALQMKTVNVRPAWQIGPNDPDAFAIRSEYEPQIPDDVTDAPVIRLLEQRRSLEQKAS